ncbi:MAG: hypothetical protein ACHQ9S_22495 [Candidatus Binatia bacterium]
MYRSDEHGRRMGMVVDDVARAERERGGDLRLESGSGDRWGALRDAARFISGRVGCAPSEHTVGNKADDNTNCHDRADAQRKQHGNNTSHQHTNGVPIYERDVITIARPNINPVGGVDAKRHEDAHAHGDFNVRAFSYTDAGSRSDGG